jgi:hypothetical protein
MMGSMKCKTTLTLKNQAYKVWLSLHMAFKELKSLKEGLKTSTELIKESQGNIHWRQGRN